MLENRLGRRLGLVDQLEDKIGRDKNISFVHFPSVPTATKVVNTLSTKLALASKRVNYRKDRCAHTPKSQQGAGRGGAEPRRAECDSILADHRGRGHDRARVAASVPYMLSSLDALSSLAGSQGLNRTVYLGNIHPETTTEDLCNATRGGVLQSLRYTQHKHPLATDKNVLEQFVTFVDSAAALTFFQVASYHGPTLNNWRLKIGWGKNAGPLPPALELAVHSGTTRNVYVGNIEDLDTFTEEKFKCDFGENGENGLANFLKEKHVSCAFANFTNLANAVKAIDGVKNNIDYVNLCIVHGKARGGGSSQPPSAIEPPEGAVNMLAQNTPPWVKEEAIEASADIPSGEVEASA